MYLTFIEIYPKLTYLSLGKQFPPMGQDLLRGGGGGGGVTYQISYISHI